MKKIKEIVLFLLISTSLFAESPIIGEWSGSFGKNQITLNIYKSVSISDSVDSLSGYVHFKGTRRTIKGTSVKINSQTYTTTLVEPCDDEWDGVFTFECITTQTSISGQWTANNGKLSRNYTLNRVPDSEIIARYIGSWSCDGDITSFNSDGTYEEKILLLNEDGTSEIENNNGRFIVKGSRLELQNSSGYQSVEFGTFGDDNRNCLFITTHESFEGEMYEQAFYPIKQ